MGWKFILSLVFAVVIALFAIANAGSVRVNFIFAVYEVSQAIVILVSAMAGALVAALLGLVKTVQMRLKMNQQEKKIAELEREKEKTLKNYAELEADYQELALQNEQQESAESPLPSLTHAEEQQAGQELQVNAEEAREEEVRDKSGV